MLVMTPENKLARGLFPQKTTVTSNPSARLKILNGCHLQTRDAALAGRSLVSNISSDSLSVPHSLQTTGTNTTINNANSLDKIKGRTMAATEAQVCRGGEGGQGGKGMLEQLKSFLMLSVLCTVYAFISCWCAGSRRWSSSLLLPI